MTTEQHLAEHKAFIIWFERYYPQLCKLYCIEILPAVDETGFIVNWENMDKEVFSIIMQITNDYYYLTH